MRKRAVVIGIDNYKKGRLHGCVRDAKELTKLLKRHDDLGKNYTVKLLTSDKSEITRPKLRESLFDLFKDARGDELLFYFSGHGVRTPWGAELVTQDFVRHSYGVSMNDVMVLANDSGARVMIILDCCFSGAIGNMPPDPRADRSIAERAMVSEDVTILAATRSSQPAIETEGHGMFTWLLLQGLAGAAADYDGSVTSLSLYSFVNRAFDDWEQQPVLKAHIRKPAVLRRCHARVDHELLQRLPMLFPEADMPITLGLEHEGEGRPLDPGQGTPEQKVFDDLKLLRNAGLLDTERDMDLYFVAIGGKTVQLTALGRHFWRLADQDKL